MNSLTPDSKRNVAQALRDVCVIPEAFPNLWLAARRSALAALAQTSAVGAAQLSPARKRWVRIEKENERRRCGADTQVALEARFARTALACASIFLIAPLAAAKTKNPKPQPTDSLDTYLATIRNPAPTEMPITGSLWNPDGRMSDMATDAKARYVGDLVTINIAESTNSAQQESSQTSRAFSASSSLAALIGTTNARAQNLFSPTSTQSLNGKGQTALATSLTTTLAASVTEVLPNGDLVIEAHRDVLVTNQKETMVLRGIIRREDLSPTNVVSSTVISHLEVSVKGNGVISESTRAPNVVVRTLLRIFNF